MLISIGEMGKLRPRKAQGLTGDSTGVDGNIRNPLQFLAWSTFSAALLCESVSVRSQ